VIRIVGAPIGQTAIMLRGRLQHPDPDQLTWFALLRRKMLAQRLKR
jgi:hypothetical protein